MKKNLLVLISAILLGTPLIANAIQPQYIDEQKAVNKNAAEQVQASSKAAEQYAIEKVNMISERYLNNFRQCEPLHINQSIDLFGFKLSFKMDINGWVDNKCSYYLTGKIGGLGKDLREVFEIPVSDEDISKIEPIVECKFTKEQLNILVDAIVARNEKNMVQINNLLKESTPEYLDDDGSAAKKDKMTPEEEKLVQMLLTGNACTVPNMNELMQNFSAIVPVTK